MIKARIDQSTRELILIYPSAYRKKAAAIKVRSYDEAATIHRIRTLKFIVAELNAFVNSREYIYTQSGRMTSSRLRAIKHLRFILDNYAEGSIHRIASRIADSRLSFAELMPTKPSPATTYFNNRIVPIIKYCDDLTNSVNTGRAQ